MPKTPWPAASEVSRHNFYILVGLPSHNESVWVVLKWVTAVNEVGQPRGIIETTEETLQLSERCDGHQKGIEII